ncbi:MAG: energy transducer TonB [Candidatus Acidiferrales bacterium]
MRRARLNDFKLYSAPATILVATLLCALAVLGGATSGARQNSSQDKDQDKNQKTSEQGFHAAELVSVGDVFIPILSVANGLTVLNVSIGNDGKITDIAVVRDLASATEPSIRAVKNWEFTPAKLDGKPIESSVTVGVVFCPLYGPSQQVTLPPVEPPGDAGEKIKSANPFAPPEITAAKFPAGPIPMNYVGPSSTVILQAIIAADGSLSYTKVVRELDGKTVPAINSMNDWEFKPAKFAEKPVRSIVVVAFGFRPYPQDSN